MDSPRMSPGERLILEDIEKTLRRDRRFERAMRAQRRTPWLAAAVTLLAPASVVLMVAGIRTSDPAVIWAFAGVWPLTLLLAFRLLCRWSTPSDSR